MSVAQAKQIERKRLLKEPPGWSAETERAFRAICMLAMLLPLLLLVILIGKALADGWPRLNWAFLTGDAERARDVILRDRTVDAHYAQISRKLQEWTTDQHVSLSQASRIQAIAKYIERMGDHATNIAEQVVFMIKGKDIRHVSRRAENRQGRPRGILFLCVHNAARSQMAEGWARKLLPPFIDVYSAGSDPASQVHPQAMSVMKEAGIDISAQQPKRTSDVPLGKVDIVVTLCVEEVCMALPRMVRRETWALPDPAGVVGDDRQTHEAFLRIRDEIRSRIETLAARISRPE